MTIETMPHVESAPTQLLNFGEAVAADLRLLGGLHTKEPDRATLSALLAVDFPNNLGVDMRSERATQACLFMSTALQGLREPLTDDTLNLLAADYADIYLLHALRAAPEESVWFNEEGCMRQEAMFQVRAWYRRYGLEAADWRVMADDHLVPQLAFIGHLLEAGTVERFTDAARFMDEHVLRWIGDFAGRVATRCATPFYAGLAGVTETYLEELREILAKTLESPRPTAEEIQRRMAATTVAEPTVKPLHFMPGQAPTW